MINCKNLTDKKRDNSTLIFLKLKKEPPTEEHLLQNTLWPELQKLYGHGYEVFSVAVNNKSKLIASAGKATKPEHAKIIIWKEFENNSQKFYKQIDILAGHELTVVQMKFSNNGDYLLSVSRDRSWKLFKQNALSYEYHSGLNSKNTYHTRIIWSCDWSHDDKYFVTTSRDKRAFIWTIGNNDNSLTIQPVTSANNQTFLELSDSITSCSFAPYFTFDKKRFYKLYFFFFTSNHTL